MTGAVPLLPLYAFIAWPRIALPFLLLPGVFEGRQASVNFCLFPKLHKNLPSRKRRNRTTRMVMQFE